MWLGGLCVLRFAMPLFFAGVVLSSFLGWFADLPVVPEGLEDAAYAPGVLGPDGQTTVRRLLWRGRRRRRRRRLIGLGV